MKKADLLNLINDDDLGLLDVKPKNSSAITADERLVTSFLEINDFIETNNREPETGKGWQEHQLASRLRALREDKSKAMILRDFDDHELLNIETKPIESVSDIFADDDLGILQSTDDDLFTLKNVPKITTMPSYVARRKVCKDFEEFKDKFEQCQSDLAAGKRKLLKFQKEQEIEPGFFFVLKGVLLYVSDMGKREMMKGKLNARLRCIFENGTESDMLLRSLSAELYKDGRRVTVHEDHVLDNMFNVTEDDKETGFIYVVRSLSDNPKIKSLEHLYKIGFSTIPVEERVKKAPEDPTFLMAPVKVVTSFECYNFNPQKLEQLLHNFFGTACLNIDIFDANNKRYTPREWFIAPLIVIEKAIALIISGGIVNYKYDSINQIIVLR